MVGGRVESAAPDELQLDESIGTRARHEYRSPQHPQDASATSSRSTTSASTSRRANWSRCSVRRARARPRCCASSPGWRLPDAGAVRFDGEDATSRSVRERGVGFVFQHYALFRHMTVFENVAFGLRVRPRNRRPTEARNSQRVNRTAQAGAARMGGRALSVAALGRSAAADRAGARAGGRTQGAAARRTVRRARREGARGAAAMAAAAARRAAHHERLRHARSGRGARTGQPRRGAQRRARSSRSERPRNCTIIRRRRSSTTSWAT